MQCVKKNSSEQALGKLARLEYHTGTGKIDRNRQGKPPQQSCTRKGTGRINREGNRRVMRKSRWVSTLQTKIKSHVLRHKTNSDTINTSNRQITRLSR